MNKRSKLEIDEKKLQTIIDNIISFLLYRKYPVEAILAIELISYFSGDAPSGDTTTIRDVINSKWLLIHEIIEIDELKKMGFIISSKLLYDHPEEVFQAHLKATEYELLFALKEGDFSWLKKRLKNIEDWLEDTTLSKTQLDQCRSLYEKFYYSNV